MVKHKTERRRSYHKHRVYHKRQEVYHALPDIFYAAAAAEPLVQPGGESSQSVIGVLSDPSMSLSEKALNAPFALEQSVMANWKSIAVLGIGGYALQWIGKKTGLNKVGTKKVKIL